MLVRTPSSSELRRAQGTLVTDGETRNVARFLKDVAEPNFERQLVAIRGTKATGGEEPDQDTSDVVHRWIDLLDRLATDPAYGAAFKDATLKNLVSNEANVRAVLAKIELGEADAGIVYKTDALVSGTKVKTIAIPESANIIAVYPIGVVRASRNKDAAAAFVRYVTGAEAQALLKAAGFDGQ